MLKALLKPKEADRSFDYATVSTGDEVSLGDRTLRFLHTPFLHWSDTQWTYLVEQQVLFIFYMSSYGNTASMAEAIRAGAEEQGGVRVSLYDLQGGETDLFVDLIEAADALAFGSPTINGDAVKPVWDLLSSLAVVNLKGKIGAAFGSFGWSGEAVRMIEDRMRGLKMRIPINGLRLKLIPTDEEIEGCHDFGRNLSGALLGDKTEGGLIDFADLA